ncbi:MAG: hypothetical protein HKO93_00450, partial [Flavobacteriales bacterium]|nr:hypothetical protein [Flavobacteriales bacterium]
DNWIWPRHTGDFALFRIYADTDNEPAPYNESNKPYSPARHLKVSLDGADEGDFVMVYGFPGRTQQYLISDAVDYVISTSNPLKIKMRETSLAIIDKAMAADDKTRIQYASKQARISNAYKKWIGQNFGLKRYNALGKKKEFENEFQEWLKSDNDAMSRYGTLIDDLKRAQNDAEKYQMAREMFIEYVYYGPEFYRLASRFNNLKNNYTDLLESGELGSTLESLKRAVSKHFKDYDIKVDLDVFKALTPMYLNNLDSDLLPEFFRSEYGSKYRSSPSLLGTRLYGSSMFTSEEKLLDFLDSFSEKSLKALDKDLGFRLMDDVYDVYFNTVRPELALKNNRIDKLMRNFVLAQQEMIPEKMFWSDANSTLRLTYGKVEGSKPRDGVEYLSHTTLDGVISKYQPGHADFDLPQKLLDLHSEGAYGRYADEDGELYVCFTGSNHTSGGNSGSPALDADGNLIGLNFDRSWESTMSDIMFSPELCRNIMVDIRYVLFIVDKFAGAGHLIDEMEIVSKK